jgi:fatty acid desaturase
MKKRVTVFLMVAVMLFTFCIAFMVKAVVPLFVWAVWAIGVGVTGVAVVADKTKSAHEQAQANNQRQEEPKGIEDTAWPRAAKSRLTGQCCA